MGTIESGFHMPPKGYLRDIRRETNNRFRSILTYSKQSQEMTKKEVPPSEGRTYELNRTSVKEYIIRNPDFLDDFIKKHVSQDRVRAWLKIASDSMPETEEDKKTDEERKVMQDSDFAAEVAERSFRQRNALVMTRNHLLFPFRYQKEELRNLIARPDASTILPDINSYLFPYTEINTKDINRVFIHMVTQLMGKHAFPMTELCYFLSTLKVNYFNVEYHNYSHALSHAQSMYWMLKQNPGVFTELEMKALMIASIAHDVGHPGVNERYLKTTASGLEKMYHSPILENHHIQTCFLILEDINCNVFCDLDANDTKRVLREIRRAIRSTDFNKYKMQVETMRQLLISSLDFENDEFREAVKSLMMMACDLCAAWKAWPEHKSTVWSLFKEFFNQGDREMNFGVDSPPQMMRMNAEEIPKFQTNFMKNIVIPIFKLVEKIFPNLKTITTATMENYKLWKTYQTN